MDNILNLVFPRPQNSDYSSLKHHMDSSRDDSWYVLMMAATAFTTQSEYKFGTLIGLKQYHQLDADRCRIRERKKKKTQTFYHAMEGTQE